MKIKLEFNEISSVKNQLEVQRDNFEQCVSAMQSNMEMLRQAWDGQAALAYQEQFMQLKPSFDKTSLLIQTIAVQLQEVMNNMQENDRLMASKFGVNNG